MMLLLSLDDNHHTLGVNEPQAGGIFPQPEATMQMAAVTVITFPMLIFVGPFELKNFTPQLFYHLTAAFVN